MFIYRLRLCGEVVSTGSYKSAGPGSNFSPGSLRTAHSVIHSPLWVGGLMGIWENFRMVSCGNPGFALALCPGEMGP